MRLKAPLHFKHSHWWKWAEPVQVHYFTLCLRYQMSEFVNVRWMLSLHGFLHGIKWIMFHGHLDCFSKPSHGVRPNTKLGDHGTPNAHNCWFIIYYHLWRPTRIKFHWNSIWLRAREHMASHYTWGSVTTLDDFGGVLGRPWDNFIWALRNSWSRLSARVWSSPQLQCRACIVQGQASHLYIDYQ